MKAKKSVLIILDGWGHGDKTKSDAIYHAQTPFIDSLYQKYPNCELLTNGKNVGLPDSQMGNSEVGHLNIGAGRIVDQDLEKINQACFSESINEEQYLQDSFQYARENNRPLHLIGLVSDGGVHSHQDHLYKLCELAKRNSVSQVFIHAFTDGRDCNPNSAKKFIEILKQNSHGARLATICGRYYAMDRDKRWERIKIAYDLLTQGKGEKSQNLIKSIQQSYDSNISDEFIKPIVKVDNQNNPIAKIEDRDAVLCFNFRTDRCREITTVLTQKNMSQYNMNKLNLHYTTMTNYDNTFRNVNVVFNKEYIKRTLGEILADQGLNQIRIAETEKYPHVTFFFSGGQEKNFKGEKRIMIDSPKVATYDLQPEMSALEVTSAVREELKKNEADFICLNFANPDMVGHTGDYSAVVKALEVVDQCTKTVVEIGVENDYAFVIIADHGNAESAINEDGTPHTAHTINPVPCFLVNTAAQKVKNGILADIAPTILDIMNIKKPPEMTGKSLIIKQ